MSLKLTPFLLFVALTIVSCSKDDKNDEKNRPLLSFIDTSIPNQAVLSDGGTLVSQMNWLYSGTANLKQAINFTMVANSITTIVLQQ